MRPIDSDVRETATARAFVEARSAGLALTEFPGPMPDDLAAAYRVQDEALALTRPPVAGWKVGRINPPVEGFDRLAGPVFADQVLDGASNPAMPVFADGFGAAEAEFLLRIGTPPASDRTDFTAADVLDHIDAVHVGIEIASSPFAGINSHGPGVTISDFGNNNGLVVGPAVTDWRTADLLAWPVTLDINDAEVGAATAATMLDGPFGAARYLFAHLARRGIALAAGQWISTGAVTGVHPVAPGDRVTARFADRYRINCTIAAR